MKDYYKILEVERTASIEEIKASYRKLARKYHPDLNRNNEEVNSIEIQEKFKEVSVAFEVLSDPEKKSLYDQGIDPNSSRSRGYSQEGDFDPFDIFNAFFGQSTGQGFGGGFGGHAGAPRPKSNGPKTGEDLLYRMPIDLKEAVFGAEKKIKVDLPVECPDCHGFGTKNGEKKQFCPDCQGTGVVSVRQNTIFGTTISQSPCPRCHGSGFFNPHPCSRCLGQGRIQEKVSVNVVIPKGSHDKDRIKLSNRGAAGINGGKNGDLYVELHLEDDEYYILSRNDIHGFIEIPVVLALAGGEQKIETLDGPQTIQIPQGIQNETKIELKDLGNFLPDSNKRGNLILHVQLSVPKLNKSQQEIASQLLAKLSHKDQEIKVIKIPKE